MSDHTPPPFVSIIIPVRNEAADMACVLTSIAAQNPPPGGYEIIVADGMSDDGTRAILNGFQARMPWIRVVDNPARITPTGLNAAIRQARGTVIIRMDAHTVYAADYVKTCVAVLQQTGADNVGGPARTAATGYLQQAIAAAYHSPFSVGGARFHDERYEGYLDTVTYGCWLKSTFEKVGYFDEEFVRNQDDEHNLRITRTGGKIWQSPRIRSWYFPRSSIKALFRQYFQYGYWKVRVIRKHRLPASIRHLVPGLFLAGLLTCLLGTPFLSSFRWAGTGALACYGAALLVASALVAARAGWKFLPVLPVVFMAYHFGYGLGFQKGLLDFVLLKQAPGRNATVLTREIAIKAPHA